MLFRRGGGGSLEVCEGSPGRTETQRRRDRIYEAVKNEVEIYSSEMHC